MIRHHEGQDSFSAEAAPMLLTSSLGPAPRAASLQGHAAVQSSGRGDHGTPWNHPFAFYAAPLSTVLLIVLSAVVLFTLIKAAATRLNSGWLVKNGGSRYFIKSGSHGYTISRR